MATEVNTVTIASSRGSTLKEITELNSTAQTVSASSGTVYFVRVDNTNNPEEAVSVKLYDSASPTVGTTDPLVVVTAQGGAIQPFTDPQGIAFSTAITVAAVKQQGTGGSTSPDNDVIVKVFI